MNIFELRFHRFSVFDFRSSVFDYKPKLLIAAFALLFTFYFLPLNAPAQSVPTPKSVLGFQPTVDKTIADWSQITNYFAKLDAASDKVKVQEIGKTTLG
ncbi:MAG: hypothetical protein ABI686_15485, partial [Acidobacteriota bacterium]